MFANSRAVESSQTTAHPRLREIVRRHLQAPYLHRPSAAGRAAFAAVQERLAAAPFVLDAGCGTGASTFGLAREHPRDVVIGVDKSAARLGAGERLAARGMAPPNAILLRCDLVDFWRLAAAAAVRCVRQYLLYPNPWPKPEQLRRRWHAHPILPSIIALGGTIELRTNWKVYAEEFSVALDEAGIESRCETFAPREPATPFERKYAASGHALWRCVAG